MPISTESNSIDIEQCKFDNYWHIYCTNTHTPRESERELAESSEYVRMNLHKYQHEHTYTYLHRTRQTGPKGIRSEQNENRMKDG